MDAPAGQPYGDVPDLGPVPQRLSVGVETVRRLVAEQFPRWADQPIAPVLRGGWDNHTFHLGPEMLVRLPSAAAYALAVEKEHRWLPELAARLPVPVPAPLGLGRPGAGYPYPWSVYRWLDGHTALGGTAADPGGLAEDLVGLLAALRAVDPAGGPRPGLHNWYRGATLRTYDAVARDALAALDGHLDTTRAAAVWDDALAASWDGVETWFHGDLAPGNLLLDDHGRLAAVLDFGTCGVGDPSCDLAIAWTLLDDAGRGLLRARLEIDDATWVRGRGWALWPSLRDLAHAVGDEDDDAVAAEARSVLDAVLVDAGGPR